MSDVKQDNLTEKQGESALFLPALSGFYATYIGKQQSMEYVAYDRIPFPEGMESLNWLNKDKCMFPYKWALYSAGHAALDPLKPSPKEDMVRNRDRENTFVLGDSGGFQIAKGKWEGDWNANSGCPKAAKKRKEVLTWLDEYMDYGMTLDIPTWVVRSPTAREACKIRTYQDAVDASKFNNEYFMANRKGIKNGGTKFLNVLQGSSHAEADDWYEQMKDYCDPDIYPDNHFNGWSMGGQNMCDIHLILKRIVTLHFDGLLQEGVQDWMHFLGTSKLEWAVVLTDIQKAVRRNYNPAFTISFDCASPFLATANGLIYTYSTMKDRGKWSYIMEPSIDDKKYATDSRKFRDAVLEDGHFPEFQFSPVMDECLASDVCIYKPGDLNKIGKEGRTSWDSFSYAIQMGHNVWKHIETVQEANRLYEEGNLPSMLVQEDHNPIHCKDLIDAIFACENKEDAMEIIDHYSKFWTRIKGTRGYNGKKAINARENVKTVFTMREETVLEIEEVTEKEIINADSQFATLFNTLDD